MQLAVAVTADNVLSSKWLNILLAKLGFASSYDEVCLFSDNFSCIYLLKNLYFTHDNTEYKEKQNLFNGSFVTSRT